MKRDSLYPSLRHFERLESHGSASQLDEILSSDIPVDIPNSAQFHDALNDYSHIVTELEGDIRIARQALDTMKHKQALAETYIYKIHALFHPIRTLPDDVLVEIFRHCIPCSLDPVQQDSLDSNAPSWLLSRVCRRWRAISVSDRRLWCIVDLPMHKYGHIPPELVFYRLEELLTRSGSCDISLRIQVGDTVEYPEIFCILRRALRRVRVLDLKMPSETIKHHFYARYDILSSLSLRFTVKQEEPDLLETFSSASALTSFTGPNVKIPVNHLRSYRTSSWPGWDLLGGMPSVEGLHFEIPKVSSNLAVEDAPSDDKPLVFNRLSSLSIEQPSTKPFITTRSCMEYVTARIRLPQLATLTLRYDWCMNVQFPRLYHPDVLTNLSIITSNSTWRAENLLAFVQLTPNVEHLVLGDSDDRAMENVLRQLMNSGGPVILPRMKRLEFGPLTLLNYKLNIVFMVLSRYTINRRKGDSEIMKCSVILNAPGMLEGFMDVWNKSVNDKTKDMVLRDAPVAFEDLFKDLFILRETTEDLILDSV